MGEICGDPSVAAEQAILKQFNLPWPVATLNAATDNA
jgi:hypothetical protein